MAIQVSLNHKTIYKYDRIINLSPQVIRLRPAPHCRTPITSYSLTINPKNHFLNWQQDPFGNFLARAVFPEKTGEFTVEVDLKADMVVINSFDFFLEKNAESVPFKYPQELKKDLTLYLKRGQHGKRFYELAAEFKTLKMGTNDFLVKINQSLEQLIKYTIRMNPGIQTCDETLEIGSGSCRDSAWLLAQLLRECGMAARFVSGYLIQLAPDIKPLTGPLGPEKDFTDLHAWTEVYLPGAGWVGLDPTSGLLAGEGHIPLCCTPDPVNAAPITGSLDKCEVEFSHNLKVTRYHEDPRVTRPFTDSQWKQINVLGNKVQKNLDKNDIQLTMGGEPTFVSADNKEDPQWSTEALGEEKYKVADKLFFKLKDQLAKKGLPHYGQGKWYPGEELPRWAMSYYWRLDKKPVWKNTSLVASIETNDSLDVKLAHKFLLAVARRTGLKEEYVIPAYEDRQYYLWQEGTLPSNLDLLKEDLQKVGKRKTLRRVLDSNFDVAGYVLPLGWSFEKKKWVSEKWTFRRGAQYLKPGDSPMGYRLPLDSLKQYPQSAYEAVPERSPFEMLGPLPDFSTAPSRHKVQVENLKKKIPVRTALNAEIRNNILCVFLPPLAFLEHYLELVAQIEDAAEELKLPVRLEGYPPPKDLRMQEFKVTPDPGVLEVNIPPSDKWDDVVSVIQKVYSTARESGLIAEKFMLDGKHIGTGGGNHIVVGGKTPAQSPFLRRPELLQSIITYWQHHPSLSYLFSSQFIGATSQHPRVDEARHENLYDLEIAFQQMPDSPTDSSYWKIDRLLRNLLIDVTGNTHRSEISIDKLYSPGSQSGQLGLVEFRGFEMPPHYQMNALQALLIRALIAYFWKHPYKSKLIRWGTDLQDRYMLPHFIREDFHRILEDLHDFNFNFQPSWFNSFYEFRFPKIGSVQINGLEIELRTALEPWAVLGEDNYFGRTSRGVDSAVERIQILVKGLSDPGLGIACNGRSVPLQPTGKRDEYVAGVRYKAWAPPATLHPTLPADAPLVFDVYQHENDFSLGGCTYYVSHPGGRSFDTFPVNAGEAESRRLALFSRQGHSPGKIEVIEERPNPEFPFTLDLRRHIQKKTIQENTVR